MFRFAHSERGAEVFFSARRLLSNGFPADCADGLPAVDAPFAAARQQVYTSSMLRPARLHNRAPGSAGPSSVAPILGRQETFLDADSPVLHQLLGRSRLGTCRPGGFAGPPRPATSGCQPPGPLCTEYQANTAGAFAL